MAAQLSESHIKDAATRTLSLAWLNMLESHMPLHLGNLALILDEHVLVLELLVRARLPTFLNVPVPFAFTSVCIVITEVPFLVVFT